MDAVDCGEGPKPSCKVIDGVKDVDGLLLLPPQLDHQRLSTFNCRKLLPHTDTLGSLRNGLHESCELAISV